MHMPPADLDLIRLHASAVALARSMRGEPDARRFVEGLSEHLREIIPHDRLLFIPEDGTRVASVPDVERNGPAPRLTLPLQGVDRVIGRLAIANVAPDVYTEAPITIGRRIAEVLGPVVEHIVLLQKERDRLRRMAVLPEVSRVLAGSLDVGNIFEQLGAVVRRVLDFDRMIVRPIGPGGALQRTALLVGDLLADLHPEHRLADYSFGARLVARELVLIRDARTELDPAFSGDRAMLEQGIRSMISAPLVFGDTVDGVLAFSKREPDGYTEADGEIVIGIAGQVVVALQHQRLAEECERLAAAEQHSRRLERRVERLRGALAGQYGFDSIVGRSPALREALDQAALVAGQDTTVLLTGESGTGKELVAPAIHYASRRAEAPFGADRLERGRFELAAGGTLFLDEVGDLTPSVQAKLLRVLQERQYERVGGTTSLRADVRLIAANAMISSTDLRCSAFLSLRCGSAKETSSSSPNTSCAHWANGWGGASRASATKLVSSCSPTPGLATSASCRTQSSAATSSPPPISASVDIVLSWLVVAPKHRSQPAPFQRPSRSSRSRSRQSWTPCGVRRATRRKPRLRSGSAAAPSIGVWSASVSLPEPSDSGHCVRSRPAS